MTPEKRIFVAAEAESKDRPTCVILGSFNKFYQEIQDTIVALEKSGIKVLAPNIGKIVKTEKGFQILDSDASQDPKKIEVGFLRKALPTDAVYIVNPGGYAGDTVAGEMGILIGHGNPIYSMEPLDSSLEGHAVWQSISKIIKPYDLPAFTHMLKSGNLDTEGYFWYKAKDLREPVWF